jgi:hypothetical protein
MYKVNVLILFALAIPLLLIVHSATVASQQSPIQLNVAIEAVRKAEAVGAEPQELAGLVGKLNSVLDLESQLQTLNPQEADKRSQLLSEISVRLIDVDTEANQIEAIASQRTMSNHIFAYVLAGIGAAFASGASYCTLLFWRKSKAKRILQLKIVPK